MTAQHVDIGFESGEPEQKDDADPGERFEKLCIELNPVIRAARQDMAEDEWCEEYAREKLAEYLRLAQPRRDFAEETRESNEQR